MTFQPAELSEFIGPGFHFQYPVRWHLDESPSGEQFSVTVRPDRDGASFWSASILRDRPSPQIALRAVLRAFEEEYGEVDSYQVSQPIAGREAVGRDVEFVCFELLSSACIRVLRTRHFTLVLLSQASDDELEACRAGFDLMTATLMCGEPEDTDAD